MKKYVTLGEVCSKGSSNIAQKDIEHNNGSYGIYGASGYIKDVDFYHQDKPYIAVVKDGAGIGRTMLLPEKTSVIGTMQYLIPNDMICVEYLYYAVTYMNLAKYFSGATIPHIYFKDYQKEKLPLLTIEEQRKISDSLQKIDRLIELCGSILEKIDVLVKSRFVEMFGDCRTNPKGWNTIELGNIAYVGSSKRGKMITPELFISQEHYEELIEATGKPIKGDLLMPSICPDGRIWVVDTDKQFYFKDGRVLWVHNINKQFDSIFLLYTLKDRIITDYQSIASGTTFAELKIFALKQCKVFEVPIEIQRNFSSFVKQTNKSKFIVINIKKNIRRVRLYDQF